MPTKVRLAFLFFCLTPALVAAQSQSVETVILDESSLSIHGSSNVNDFDCHYEDSFEPDTLNHEVEVNENEVDISGDDLTMYVESFECGKKGITRDFRKTLKSDEYPTIDVKLERLLHRNGEPEIAEVLISLAGISRIYQVDLATELNPDGTNKVSGNAVIKMSDFNLEPPRALFGLVKVNDEMNINFILSVKQ